MNHPAPDPTRGPLQDPFAAAHHRRLVRAGFHPAPPMSPVLGRLTTGTQRRVP